MILISDGDRGMTTFEPILFEEEAPPPHAAHCERCELSRHRQRVVWGEGNPNAPVMIILDNPGAREDREGRPFVCGTRETLQYGMEQAGLKTRLTYVTYLLKCRPVRAYDKPLAREACRAHLQFQLNAKAPQLLLGLGNTVAQALLNDPDAEVKHLRGKWHQVEGRSIAFSYHPLAVRRRPNLMSRFIEDLTRVSASIHSMLKMNQ